MVYDPSEEALNHPEKRPVFTRPNLPKFDPTPSNFSATNVWWLANLSHLAYYSAEDVKRELSRVGLDLVHFIDAQGTQGFLADGEGFSVLSLRGTQPPSADVLIKILRQKVEPAKLEEAARKELEDVLTDLDAELVEWPGASRPRVHKGFLGGLDRAWQDEIAPFLEERSEKKIPVWYTGHSLGAALAVLAAARRSPAGLVTFGEPLVGDADLLSLVPDPCHFRLVNCCDIVTTLPPLLHYKHCGNLWFLDDNGDLLPQPTARQILTAKLRGSFKYQRTLPWFRSGVVKTRAWADHSIPNYTAALEKKLP